MTNVVPFKKMATKQRLKTQYFVILKKCTERITIAVLLSLSFTNISGGAARHEKVSPKTWRILAFADAIWFLSLQVFTTDQPRSRAFKKTFAPLFFAKNFYGLVVFGKKNQR